MGHYAHLIPTLAPDVLRKAAGGFAGETDVVKLAVLGLAAKLVVVYEEIEASSENEQGGSSSESENAQNGSSKGADKKMTTTTKTMKAKKTVELLFGYVANCARFDVSVDVRDSARMLRALVEGRCGGQLTFQQVKDVLFGNKQSKLDTFSTLDSYHGGMSFLFTYFFRN
jgi:vesicle coat complex subunit